MGIFRNLIGDDKRAVAFYSILAAIVMITGKTVAGLLTGSLAIITDAVHSCLDLGASIITYFAVRISGQPADRHHHYGHGKVEALAALIQVFLLSLTCLGIIFEAVRRLVGKHEGIDVNFWAFLVIVGAIIIDFTRVRALRRVARRYHSQALEADALNFMTDIYASLVVLFGLAAVKLGLPAADAIAAIGVAIFIITATFRLGKRSIDVLLDSAPMAAEEQIRKIVSAEPEIIGISSLRLRSDGRTTFAEVYLDVDRTMSFARASELKEHIRASVQRALPDVDITCSFTPVSPDSEATADAIGYVVSSFGLTAHHLIIREEGDGYFVSMHVEMPGGVTLREAHDLATTITGRLHEAIPALKKVVIHTQPFKGDESDPLPREYDIEQTAARIKRVVENMAEVEDCHNIVLIPYKNGLALSADLRLDGRLSLAQTDHISLDIQGRLRHDIPELESITLHLEPFKR